MQIAATEALASLSHGIRAIIPPTVMRETEYRESTRELGSNERVMSAF